jgi:hypothetical protein
LGQSDFQAYVARAYAALKEIAPVAAWQSKPGSDELKEEEALIQNLNFRSALQFAQAWFSGWSPLALMAIVGVPEMEAANLEDLVDRRIQELDQIVGNTE